MGFPGGPNIEQISKNGDENTFKFPVTTFRKKENWYDFSYSGLKTACIHQLEKFKSKDNPTTKNNIAASFQKAAFENLITPLKRSNQRYSNQQIGNSRRCCKQFILKRKNK